MYTDRLKDTRLHGYTARVTLLYGYIGTALRLYTYTLTGGDVIYVHNLMTGVEKGTGEMLFTPSPILKAQHQYESSKL